jgi:hypothetical protein
VELVPFPVVFLMRGFRFGKRVDAILLALVLVVSSAKSAVAQEKQRAEVSVDSYEVYSAVLNQRHGSWFKQKEPVLISSHTVLEPQHHQGCPVQGEQSAVVRNLLSKLLAEKQEFKIAAKLRLPGPYELFTGRADIRTNHEPGLVFLSAVEFSEDRSKAIVLVGHICGGRCGGGYVWILDRRNGSWQISNDRLNCGWIS